MASDESSKKAKGVKIDSALIQTADLPSELQDELKSLGVTVYDQEEFEAGILKQIDDEVRRQTSEQDKKFLLKNYSDVKGEINAVRNELNKISKTISGLLALPITTVAGHLRELRAAQERKVQQMSSLRAKEQDILKKLSSREDPAGDFGGTDSLRDEAFGIPTEVESEREKLIRIGHLTPFESRVGDIESSSSSSGGQSAERDDVTITQEDDDHSKQAIATDQGQCQANIQLIKDHTLPQIPKAAAVNTITESTSQEGWKRTSEVGAEALERDTSEDQEDLDEYIPDLAEFMNFDSSSPSSNESEYVTDEEMGEVKTKKKKKMKLRELSSEGDLSSSDEDRRKKRGIGKMKRMPSRYSDDGDRDHYLIRIQGYEKTKAELDSEEFPDEKLDGGFTVPGSVWHRLYRYQRTGVRWLWELHRHQAGGVVGDEMGLGKTIELIAFLAGLRVSSLRSLVTGQIGLGPVLIVCPATVLHQWVSEFHTWWPPFRVAVFHGSGAYSGSKKRLVDQIVKDNGVLLTTYAGMRMAKDLLLSCKWEYVVLDEGHKIRNPDAEITLTCKQVSTPHRLILSGSPMQNNLRELWSLFDFVFPGKLGTLPVFMAEFSVPITNGGYANASEVQVQTAYKCACILRDTINPYMLRRLKKNVRLDLPNMKEQVLFCQLTDYQYDLYSDFLHGPSVQTVLKYGRMVFSSIMTLRKLCNHPDLVTNDYSEQVTKDGKSVASSSREEEDEGGDFDIIPAPKSRKKAKERESKEGSEEEEEEEEEESYGYWGRAGKMKAVAHLLRMWKTGNHRVLLFSQSKGMLNILERFIKHRKYSYRRMDGSTPVSTRQPMVNEFNRDDSIFVFLLTTRVGGLGINLTGANRVILYDPDWNPSTDIQARERAWRIGQTREVTIYRLLTSGTIEEKIYHRQIFKQFLTNRILKDPRQKRFFKSNNLMELFTLDSSATGGVTETSAIFAGTGSEIFPRDSRFSSKKSPTRKRKREEKDSAKGKGKLKAVASSEGVTTVVSGSDGTGSGATAIDGPCTSSISGRLTAQVGHAWKKKKKKKRHKRSRSVRVEGEEIKGVSGVCVYEPPTKEETDTDDFILQKLFKKGGVHSALQHDAIMNSTDPDYVLVEAEASKASKSATRALKESRRLCRQTGAGHGRPTWTGQHGEAGAPTVSKIPRFGLGAQLKSNSGQGSSGSQQEDGEEAFGGSKLGGSDSTGSVNGSVNTSSNVLLAKMRQRNTHTTRDGSEGGVGGANATHHDGHSKLLKEIRDFIALQGQVNGQATTKEILDQFSGRLPASNAAMFKAMLYEICDFTRYHGDGVWILKEEYQ